MYGRSGFCLQTKKSKQVWAIFNSYAVWRFGLGCALTLTKLKFLP